MKQRILILFLLLASMFSSLKAQDDEDFQSLVDENNNADYEPKRLVRDDSLELINHHFNIKDFNKSLITFILKSKKKSPYKWTTRREDEIGNGLSPFFRHGIILSTDHRKPLNQIDNIDSIRRHKKKKPFKWG